jgi:outer membrane protein TolC
MIFNVRRVLALVMSMVITSSLAAQDENKFSLKEAQEYALKNNYNLINAERDIEVAKKRVWETTAIGLPQVSSEATFQNYIDLPTSLVPANAFNPMAPEGQFAELQFGTDYNTTATISASQLIFDGSYIVGLQAAKTYKQLSVHTKDKSEQEIKDAIAQAYHTAIGAERNHKSLLDNYKSSITLLNETKALYEEGLTEEQNVSQLELNTASLENAVKQAERQIVIALNMLKFQMGMDVNQNITLTDDFESLIEMNENNSELLSAQFSFSNHFDYELVQTNERLMKLLYRKEKYSFAPTFSAFFSHSQQNMNNTFDAFSGGKWYPGTLWGVNLKLPLFTSGMRLAKLSQAKIEYEKATTNSKQVEQSLIIQAQTAQSNYTMAYDTYHTQKKNLDLAKSIHNKTIKKYGEGFVSSMEFTQSQNQLLAVEGQYTKSVYDLLNAKSALKKALGSE